jgi:hypothetical protein
MTDDENAKELAHIAFGRRKGDPRDELRFIGIWRAS